MYSRLRSTIRVHTPFKRFVSCFGSNSDGNKYIVCVSYDGKYAKFYFDLNAKTYRMDTFTDLMGSSPSSSSSSPTFSPTYSPNSSPAFAPSSSSLSPLSSPGNKTK